MKKMNSTSKRKWILGGTLAFGAVALLTTGFATWIIGVSRTETNGDTTVAVDTSVNQSAILEAKLSDSRIKLAEQTKFSGEFINSDEEPGGDLKVTFEYIKFTYGNDFLSQEQENEIKSIDFSLPSSAPTGLESVDFASNSAITTKNNKTNFRTGSETGWTYINAPASITKEELDANTTTSEGVTTINITNKDVSFTWGTYFENIASPATYYDAKLKEKKTAGGPSAIDLANVNEELNAMKEALDTKTIHLLVTVNVGAKQ